MTEWFADTSYFLAFVHRDDEAHELAMELTGTFQGRLVTTQWVLLEFVNALSNARLRESAAGFLEWLETHDVVEILEATGDGFARGMERFRQRPDKDWSLTDCVSFLVMEERGIREALTADHHFEQAGFAALLK
jgi:predicted nucleic acid-binding protein